MAVPQHQPGEPIHPEPRGLVAGGGVPKRDIGRAVQKVRRSVRTGIVHRQKVPHPKRPMMRQEMREALGLVADAEKGEDIARSDLARAVADGGKLAPTPQSAPEEPLPKMPEPRGEHHAGQAVRLGPFTDGAGMGQAAGKKGRRAQAYCAAFCIAVRSRRKSANSAPNSGRDKPNATVACRKPIFEPQS
jgi:hypothetical protein